MSSLNLFHGPLSFCGLSSNLGFKLNSVSKASLLTLVVSIQMLFKLTKSWPVCPKAPSRKQQIKQLCGRPWPGPLSWADCKEVLY